MATRTISASGGTRNVNDAASFDEGVAPVAGDDIVARADGTSGNLILNAATTVRSLDLLHYSATISGSAGLTLGTSSVGPAGYILRIPATVNWTATGQIVLASSTTGNLIDTNNAPLSTFSATIAGGGYTLASAFFAAAFTWTRGTFNSAAYAMSVRSFNSNNANTRSITLDNSAIELRQVGTATTMIDLGTTTGLTWSASGTVWNITGVQSTGASTIATGAKDIGTVNYTIGGARGLIFTGAGTARLSVTGAARTLTFPAGVTFTLPTVPTLAGTGTGGRLSIRSSSAGSTATISLASGTVLGSFLDIQDNTATGGATFRATGSVIGTNVSGWALYGSVTISTTSAVTDAGEKVGMGSTTISAATGLSGLDGHPYGTGSVTISTATGITVAGEKKASGSVTIATAVALSLAGLNLPAADFCLAWVFTPDVDATEDVGGQILVKGSTPGSSPAVVLQVGYDAATQKFEVRLQSTAVLSSPAQTFVAGDRVRLAVRLDPDDGLTLSVKAGSGGVTHSRNADIKHLAASRLDELRLGAVDPSVTWGSGTWGSGFWGGLSRPVGVIENIMGFVDGLTDDEVETLFSATHRLDGLPSPEARLVWFVPGSPRPIPSASVLVSGRRYEVDDGGDRLTDAGVTKAVAALSSAVTSTDGIGLTTGGRIDDLVAFLATTDDEDDLADHHAQAAADSRQEVRVR